MADVRQGEAANLIAPILCLLLASCSAPYGVRHASPEKVHRALTANVLSTGDLSNFSSIALHRQNLTEAFDDDPEGTLRLLHEELRAGRLSVDDLYVLAELSFHHAAREGGKPHFLAAAVYAYAFLFPYEGAAPLEFDPRLRVTMDIYNRALTEAFESANGQHVDIGGGTYPLPFGQIAISFDDRQLLWGKRLITEFVPVAELEVIGFENRYRQPGIGAPLAAATQPVDPNTPLNDFVGPKVRVPVTALLRMERPREQVRETELTGELELHASTEKLTVQIDGRVVPLEQESTAALALTLTVGQPWAQELSVFLGRVLQIERGPRFGGREPHRRGRIPVVFVHGTASNFSVWANMLNDLESDPVIRKHFEFWFFTYDSGQPILYSGSLLRKSLTEAVHAFRADGPDPCLENMVVIGHSQGGLLVKLTAIDSGDQFWRNTSDLPFDEIELSDETRTLLQDVMFVRPLPFVDRVVFIATPHHGSYLAGPNIVRRLAQRMITLPATLVRDSAELLTAKEIRRKTRLETLPTSIDNMSPGHPFIVTIGRIPLSPDVAAHSIIGVNADGPIEQGGDGVVKYSSARIDGVESELIVPYPHSMQAKPEVVAEVQRILHQHLEVNRCVESEPR